MEENELIMLLIGFGVTVFILANQKRLKLIPGYTILVGSFYFMVTGWVCVILDNFFLTNLINLIEHLSYTASSILLAIWSWQTLIKRRKTS